MAGFSGGEDDELISGINVTPLVDVVLVLLIIFMVTATYIVRAAVEVELPRVAHGGEATGTILTVVLTRDGKVYLDGVQRTEQELVARTREAVRKDSATRAIISADKGALHGAVVRAIDLVRDGGVTRFAIHVERER
jgi:biopolymer transport protein ExbD